MAKRMVDVILAGIACLVLAPLLAAVSLVIAITMGQPVLHRDRRSGRGGEPFELLKFRTMRALRPGERIPDDDAERVTQVGRFVRSTSIDELPALLNVLRGEMSLVGPRPLPVRYLDRLSPTHRHRLDVRPGITGLSQVKGRNLLSWDERFELDVWYVEHRHLGLDLTILVRTIITVLGRRGVSPDGGDYTMPEFTGGHAGSQPNG